MDFDGRFVSVREEGRRKSGADFCPLNAASPLIDNGAGIRTGDRMASHLMAIEVLALSLSTPDRRLVAEDTPVLGVLGSGSWELTC